MSTSSRARKKPVIGDSTMAALVFSSPAHTTAARAGLGDAGADQPADQRMRAAGGNAGPPGDQIPGDRAHQGPEDHPRVDDLGGHDPGADGLRDMQPEDQERDEVEECRPHHRIARPQHARRDDGRDRVGGIVQAIEKIEHKRDHDQADQDRQAEYRIHAELVRSQMIDDEWS